MTFGEYQQLARRTVNQRLDKDDLRQHALYGMAGEVGEIHSLFQKVFQGHEMDTMHLAKEIGDLMWFVSELCDVFGIEMDVCAEMNIEKLRKRYPMGFEVEKSLKRAEGDI